jgi:hypothetical protein
VRYPRIALGRVASSLTASYGTLVCFVGSERERACAIRSSEIRIIA